ncbi:EAL domain-containing protein [Actinoplanes sp. NPDC051859]|uniref:EAL domain-containing protein n=1 Tax=Actinoplanes sp. NPDC051859 TaxID=3363909 RepID=UPI0037A9D64E
MAPVPHSGRPDPDLTHAMMIAALNRALADCGYPPVPDDPTGTPGTGASAPPSPWATASASAQPSFGSSAPDSPLPSSAVPANPAVSPANPAVSPADPAVSPADPAVSPADPAVPPANPGVPALPANPDVTGVPALSPAASGGSGAGTADALCRGNDCPLVAGAVDCGCLPPGELGDLVGSAADRLIDEARRRADGIVAAALETAVEYTDAALHQAARTVQTAGLVTPAVTTPPGVAAPVLQALSDGAGGGRSVGERWLAAATAAGVYLPLDECGAAQALDTFAARMRNAAGAVPPDLDAAYRVGGEVVALGLGRPEALPASLTVLLDHLADGDRVHRGARQATGGFAAGFAAALQANILAQQESLHRATQRAAREFQLALHTSEARHRRHAYYDPVTGLSSRSRLLHRLRQAVHGDDTTRHAGLCLVELGGHGSAGERFGVHVADQVLAEAARRLQLAVRHPDYLAARYGPHSFAVLVQDSGGVAHLVDLAERIVLALREPVFLPAAGHTVTLLTHVGVVDMPTAVLDPGSLLIDAEIALRRARCTPHGWAVHDNQPAAHQPAAHQPAAHHPPGSAADTADLRAVTQSVSPTVRAGSALGTPRSIETATGWAAPAGKTSPGAAAGLVTGPPAYQPIIDLGGGRIVGLHTRTTWRHPHLGALDLAQIGQLTGDQHAVARLAAALLHQACRQAMQWDGGESGPFIGVDVPIRQIGHPEAADVVQHALTTSGLPPHRLHLHLSGPDAVPAGAHSHAVLHTLASLGVRLILDDFGTGSSSLSYLRGLPLHGLRTPAGLLHPASDRDPSLGAAVADHDLLAGMAGIAHALGLTLTVHGVDDELRADILAGTGCDNAQGLRYVAPATPHQVPVLLRRSLVGLSGRDCGLVTL